MKVTSNYMKAALCAYYRFGRGAKFVATECGRFNSDVLVIHNANLVEIEIKVSKADLNNDFKKPKHRIFETLTAKEIPNYFYFAVPKALVAHAVSKCIGKPYGVMEVQEPKGLIKRQFWVDTYGNAVSRSELLAKRYGWELVTLKEYNKGWVVIMGQEGNLDWKERVKVIKRASKLHDSPPSRRTQQTIVNRLSSEMTNLRVKGEIANNK